MALVLGFGVILGATAIGACGSQSQSHSSASGRSQPQSGSPDGASSDRARQQAIRLGEQVDNWTAQESACVTDRLTAAGIPPSRQVYLWRHAQVVINDPGVLAKSEAATATCRGTAPLPATTPHTTTTQTTPPGQVTNTAQANLSLQASYTDQLGYKYGFTIRAPQTLAPFLVWSPGDPGIEKVLVSNTPGPPVDLVAEDRTPERDAPFSSAATDVDVLLLYRVGHAVANDAENVAGPNVSNRPPIYLSFEFQFGHFTETSIPQNTSITFEPDVPAQAPYVSGSPQLAEKDKAIITADLSTPPAYIVLAGTTEGGDWLGNQDTATASATNCIAGDSAVVAAFDGSGAVVSCSEISRALASILNA